MKLCVLCLVCLLQLDLARYGLSRRHDLQDGRRVAPSRVAGRVRPLFARRGQFERQRIHVPKPKVSSVPPNHITPSVKQDVNPIRPTCSQLTHTCTPMSGCCDSHASCHCRFFNAICYCRRTKSQHENKRNVSVSKLGQKHTSGTDQ